MCYPKPGPRCSAHAAAKRARIQQQIMATRDLKMSGDDQAYARIEPLLKQRDAAEAEYRLTPAGIHQLERQLRHNPGDYQTELALQTAQAERARRIALVKPQHRHETAHHQIKTDPHTYTRTALANNGDTLTTMGEDDADVHTLLRESETWAHTLTPEEIDALHWYSTAGYADINGHLSHPDHTKPTRGTAIQQTINHLDSALAKVNADKTAIVYRRHFFYTPAGGFNHLTLTEQQTHFAKGSIYRPGFYMSTSLNPGNAPADNNRVAFLEIKTHRGVSLSAVAQQGTNEKEILLPRDGAYRVVGNTNQVTIDRQGETHTLTVIQLEELPD